MPTKHSNVFIRLHKWAARQHENFLTESLALVLQVMVERQPHLAYDFIRRLSSGFIAMPFDEQRIIEIRTQVSTELGRPDLEISTPDCISVFEVKAEAEIRAGQLEGNREYLNKCVYPQKALFTITKYAPTILPEGETPDYSLRWYEVADMIELALNDPRLDDPASAFVAQCFHDFLKEQNMAIAQVGWQLAEGAKALHSFLVMLQEAARACQVSTKKEMNLEYDGFILEGGKYGTGIDLREPD